MPHNRSVIDAQCKKSLKSASNNSTKEEENNNCEEQISNEVETSKSNSKFRDRIVSVLPIRNINSKVNKYPLKQVNGCVFYNDGVLNNLRQIEIDMKYLERVVLQHESDIKLIRNE